MLPAPDLPRITFVLGKGGVGRSTVAAALGLWLSQRGERVLVFEWTIAEAIAPWFGKPPAGFYPLEVAPRLSVANYRLETALHDYFVNHLGLGVFYRRVVDSPPMRRLVEAAPGLAELLFIGELWWLTTLAEQETGFRVDRVVVDTPATGHGASLLDLPSMLSTFGASGLLALEIGRVVKMMGDPAWTGAVVVSLAEELAVEETLELVPRATRDFGRRPLAAFVNRSVEGLVRDVARPPWLEALAPRLSPAAAEGLEVLHAELRGRVRREAQLRAALEGQTDRGVFSLTEKLALAGPCAPLDVVTALSRRLAEVLGGPP